MTYKTTACLPIDAGKILEKKNFHKNPSLFTKRCPPNNSLSNYSVYSSISAPDSVTNEKPQWGTSFCHHDDTIISFDAGLMEPEQTTILSTELETTMDLLNNPNDPNGFYLTGDNIWEGLVLLNGPVYVYDANGVPASLEIKEESFIVPTAEDAGIYLIEGSSLKARKVYFGPSLDNVIGWKGICLEGKPAEFLFDKNEIRCAEKGISLQNYDYVRISDTIFKWCTDGVIAYPGTVRVNNCVFDDSYRTAITYYMETMPSDPNIGDPNFPGDPNDFISDAIPGSGLYVDNCTITGSFYYGYAHDYGVFVHGTNEMENAGRFEITDCLITSSVVAGIYQEGWQSALWQNNAFFHNASVTNPENPFEDPDSQYIPDDPLYDPFHYYVNNGTDNWDMLYYIWPESGIIDAGSRHIFNSPLIGKTNCVTGEPDIFMEDIGYHYPNEDYYDEGIILQSDITWDNLINFDDFIILARDWQWSLDPNDWPTTDPNNPVYHEPNSLLDTDGDGWRRTYRARRPVANVR